MSSTIALREKVMDTEQIDKMLRSAEEAILINGHTAGVWVSAQSVLDLIAEIEVLRTWK